MARRHLAHLTVCAVVALTLGACSPPSNVRTESANAIANSVTTTTEGPPGTESVHEEPPVGNDPEAPRPLPTPASEGLLFELSELTVEVTRRETTADQPPDGYDGFMSVVQLGDSSFVASGFDTRFEGAQPERSALWRSSDGSFWERVGDPVGARAGQQQIAALYLEDDQVHVLETGLDGQLEGNGTTSIEFGLTVEWVSDEGLKWGSQALVGNNMVSGVAEVDGEIVAYGAARPNSDGDFAASIIRPPKGAGDWTAAEIADASGATFPGSYIADMHTVDDTIVAVGATAHTDPLSSNVGSLQDMFLTSGVSDVAIWRSTDSGSTWSFISTDTFTGKSGPANATTLVELNGWLYMLTATVEAYQTTVVLHRTADLGDTWERVRFEKALAGGVGNATELTNFGLYAVDGYLVVLEERFGLAQNMYMTVIDPVAGDSVTHSITDGLGVIQVEDILDTEHGAFGFGRTELGTDESDLQLIDIHLVDPGSTTTPV